MLWLLQVEQNADFRAPVAGCGAAPSFAVQWGGGGDRGPGLVHPGRLWHGMRLHDLVSGDVCRIRGELRHASALQKLLVLPHQRRAVQLLGHAGTRVAPAHHADRSGKIHNLGFKCSTLVRNSEYKTQIPFRAGNRERDGIVLIWLLSLSNSR